MDPKRLKRHSQHWEAGTSSVRRIAVGGIIFAVLILFKVVEPYHSVNELHGQVDDLEKLEQTNTELQQQLRAIGDELDNIEAAIRVPPWNAEIDDLIEFFQRRNNGGPEQNTSPQDRADEAIRNIASNMRTIVVAPLREVTSNPAVPVELSSYPGRIETEIADWESRYVGDETWYSTVPDKLGTADEISTAIAEMNQEIGTVLDGIDFEARLEEMAGDVDTRLPEVEAMLAEIRSDIANANERITAALNHALPSWAKDMISADSMVELYPWILVAIALYLVGRALVATRHFHGMADGEEWSAEERNDPILSSPWTLTWRGYTGTLGTLALYIAVLGTLTFCLHRSLNPAAAAASANGMIPGDATATVSTNLPIGLAYALLLATALVVVIVPLRDRQAAASESKSRGD